MEFYTFELQDEEKGDLSFFLSSDFPENGSGYLAIETELTFPQLSKAIKHIKVGNLQVSGTVWSLSLLLRGSEVSVHKQKDTYYIPLDWVDAADPFVVDFHRDNDLEMQILATTMKLLVVTCAKPYPCSWKVVEVDYDVSADNKIYTLKNLQKHRVAQIGVYAHKINAWVLDSVLKDGDENVATLPDSFCGTTIDKKMHGLPVSKQPILTYSFVNYLKSEEGGFVFKETPSVAFTFDEQFLPEEMPKPVILAIITRE